MWVIVGKSQALEDLIFEEPPLSSIRSPFLKPITPPHTHLWTLQFIEALLQKDYILFIHSFSYEKEDVYLYMIGAVCLYDHFLKLCPWGRFHGSRLVFHGSRLVFMVFMVPGWFFMVLHGSRLVFHGSRSVFMVFYGSRLVFHVFSSEYTCLNCILARQSSLGPPPGGRHRT